MGHINKPSYLYHYRDIPAWIRQSPICFHLLAEFARRARRLEGYISWNGENIHLKPRQFITGRVSVSAEIGITEGEYRGAYRKLTRYGLVRTIKVTNRYTIAELDSDNIFFINPKTDQPSEEPPKLPAPNQQLTTNNKENNDNNVKSRLSKSENDQQVQNYSPRKTTSGFASGIELLRPKRKELGI